MKNKRQDSTNDFNKDSTNDFNKDSTNDFNKDSTNDFNKDSTNKKSFNSIFWLKGEGMNRRNRNIETVKDLIKSGLSYQQIFRKARKYFTFKKFNEYYEIALDEVNNPDEESFMDYVKRKEKEGKK